jgi:hypothetical protein
MWGEKVGKLVRGADKSIVASRVNVSRILNGESKFMLQDLAKSWGISARFLEFIGESVCKRLDKFLKFFQRSWVKNGVKSDIGIILGNDRDVGEERIIVFLWSARRSNSSLEDEEIKCKEGEGLGGRWRILEMAISAGSRCEKGVETFGKSRLWAQDF